MPLIFYSKRLIVCIPVRQDFIIDDQDFIQYLNHRNGISYDPSEVYSLGFLYSDFNVR